MIDYQNLPLGVGYTVRGNCRQFTASLIDKDGKRKYNTFSIKRYGEKEAFEMAKAVCEKVEKERHEAFLNRVYTDNGDGTTSMKLYYKEHELVYKIDTADVEKVQKKYWVCTNEGYAVNTNPWIYLHRYIMNAEDGQYVVHLDKDITNCTRANLLVTNHLKDSNNRWGKSINTLMATRGQERRDGIKELVSGIKICCSQCGFDDERALHFDHISRDEKVINIARSKSFNQIVEEIDKCQVLCANCHSRKTMLEYPTEKKPRPHREKAVTLVNELKRNVYKCCEICQKSVEEGFEQSFHFDHINPLDKVDNISAIANHYNDEEILLNELEKCRLLCANCHSIHTAEQHEKGMFKEKMSREIHPKQKKTGRASRNTSAKKKNQPLNQQEKSC
jgi:hypothetical protein